MTGKKATDTSRRKDDHIRICLEKKPMASTNLLDCIELVHSPLPGVDYDEIDISTTFLGKELQAPMMISAMTGGSTNGENVNRNLAVAASKLGIGLGVGSQRPAHEDKALVPSYSVVKEYDIPLLMANIGIPQLVSGFRKGGLSGSENIIRRSLEMIGTELICIHLNYLQEIVQPEGELLARGAMDVIRTHSRDFTIIVKETGAGFDIGTIRKLVEAGVAAVDVGGKGGTSFSAVEHYRNRGNKAKDDTELGKMLWDWGIPTPVVVSEASGIVPLIATGGVRNGMDVFKLLSLGAGIAGIAGVLLKPAMKGEEKVVKRLERIISELKSVMFLTGCSSVGHIPTVKKIFYPPLTYWLEQGTGRGE